MDFLQQSAIREAALQYTSENLNLRLNENKNKNKNKKHCFFSRISRFVRRLFCLSVPVTVPDIDTRPRPRPRPGTPRYFNGRYPRYRQYPKHREYRKRRSRRRQWSEQMKYSVEGSVIMSHP